MVAAGVANEVVAVDTAVEVVVTVEVAEELTVAVDTAVLGVVFVAGVGRVTGNGGPVLGVWLNPSIAECLSIAKQLRKYKNRKSNKRKLQILVRFLQYHSFPKVRSIAR